MKRLAVLISDVGTGTNLQAIIDAVRARKINAEIVLVISDTDKAYGLKRARKYRLPSAICPRKEKLLGILKKYRPDYICLAGWKQFVAQEVIDRFPERILNVHPGLIPDSSDGFVLNPDGTAALWNRGKLGPKAVKNFLGKRATFAGSSIHFLTREFDFGPVLTRAFVKILPNDNPESLYDRIKREEHKMYVAVLAQLCHEP